MLVNASAKQGYHEGMSYIIRHKDFYEVFVLALPNKISNAGSFYLSKISAIEHFFMQFQLENKDLLQGVLRSPLHLASHNLCENHSKLCLKQQQVQVWSKEGGAYLTPRETKCLRLIRLGYSTKKVATFLDISSRSVETYLNRIKLRTGITNRSEYLKLCELQSLETQTQKRGG